MSSPVMMFRLRMFTSVRRFVAVARIPRPPAASTVPSGETNSAAMTSPVPWATKVAEIPSVVSVPSVAMSCAREISMTIEGRLAVREGPRWESEQDACRTHASTEKSPRPASR